MKKILLFIQLLAIAVIANSQACTPSVSVGASPSGSICHGTSVTFTATPVNGGSPSYQWVKNGVNVGSNSATYTDAGLNNNDNIQVIMTSTASCASPTTATSTPITMVVNPVLTPSVSTSASPSGPICTGTSVTFTATPTNGGTPSYQWKKNGGNVGSNSATYTDAGLNNNDAITVVMTSNATCVSPTTATSTAITETVNPILTPSVAIAASPSGPVCSSVTVTFTASPTNGGTTPSYQWKKNGNNVGTNSATYADNGLLDQDVISVVMTSNYPCLTTPTGTASVTEQVFITPAAVITPLGATRFCQGGNLLLSAPSTGNALDFNGGRVTATGAYDVDVNDFTVEAWIYPRANTKGTIVAQGAFSCTTQGYLFEYNANGNGSLTLQTSDGTTCQGIVQTSGGLILNQWQHVAASVKRGASGNLTVLYVNGVAVASGNIPNGDLTNTTLNIGGSSVSGFNFNGRIDEVRVWNVARTQANIKGTMNAIIPGNTSGLVGYYRLDEISGTTTADITAGGANGTLTGTTIWQVPSSSPVSENLGASFLYNWSTGSLSQSTIANANGIYSVQVVNSAHSACAANATITITVDTLPVAKIDTVAPLCAGSTLNLTGHGGGTYSWTGPNAFTSTSQSPSISNATTFASGNYALTVTNSGGCTGSVTRQITVNALPVASANSNSPQCVGSTLNLSASGGTSYSWSGPNGFTATQANAHINTVTTAAGGTYTVTVTNTAGCTATATVSVTVNTLPTPTASGNGPLCAGGTVNLISSGGTSYTWSGPNSFGSSQQSPSILNALAAASGIYTVRVTDANGCSATATASVTVNALPTAAAGSNSPVCVGGSLNLTSGGGTSFSWSGPNSFSITSQYPSITGVTTAAGGTYTVTVSDANNCSATASVSVTVNIPPVVTAGNDGPKCAGSLLNFTSSAGSSFVWSGPNGFNSTQQNPSIGNTTSAATGTYSVTVTVNGCSGTATTSATIYALPPATANNSTTGVQCAGETIDLTSSGGTSYSWSGPLAFASTQQNPVITNAGALSTGTYTVTVTDGNGCSASASTSLTVISIPAAAIAGLPGPTCAGDILDLSADGGVSYAWSGPNGFSSNSQDAFIPNVTTAATGTYTVTVTNAGNCSATASTVVTITTQPIISTCPGNMTVHTDPNLCSAVVNFAPVTSGIPAPNVTYSQNPGTAFPVGNTTVLISAANTCGTITCSFIITVVDQQAPSITCPANITVLATQATCNKTLAIPGPSVGDNCGVASVTNSYTGASNANGTYPVGTTNVVWTVTDVHGNVSTCTQVITILPCLSVTGTASNTLCPGTSLGSISTTSAGGQGPYGYLWSNGATSANISGLAAGNYTLTVTDGVLNTVVTTFTVGTTIPAAMPASPSAISGLASFCVFSTYTYSIPAVANATTYIWTVPTNASIVSGQGTTQVSVQFVTGFASGSISVYASNCVGNSAAVTLAVTKSQAPKNPVAITGLANVCANSMATYTTAAVSGATSYTWTAPANASIFAGQGTNTVTVQFNATFSSGALKVLASNCAGSSGAVSVNISKLTSTQLPAAVSDIDIYPSLADPTGVCPGDVVSYTLMNDVPEAYASSYNWIAPPNATIIAGQGTIVVTVAYQAGYTGGNLSAYASNCNGSSAATIQSIPLNTAPVASGGISGSNSVCTGFGYVYSVNAFGDASTYTWTVPANTVIVSGQGTTSITVQVLPGFTSGNVGVYGTNCAGNSSTVTLAISKAASVPASPSITGAITACVGNVLTYTAQWESNATSYNWTVPANTTILSGQGSTRITLQFLTGFTGGTIKAVASNCFGAGSADAITVSLCKPKIDETEGINNVSDEGFNAKIYPNPFSNEFRLAIESSNDEAVYVRIFNINGQLVEERKEVTSGSEINMGSNFASGVYIVQIKQGDNTKVLRIIKSE